MADRTRIVLSLLLILGLSIEACLASQSQEEQATQAVLKSLSEENELLKDRMAEYDRRFRAMGDQLDMLQDHNTLILQHLVDAGAETRSQAGQQSQTAGHGRHLLSSTSSNITTTIDADGVVTPTVEASSDIVLDSRSLTSSLEYYDNALDILQDYLFENDPSFFYENVYSFNLSLAATVVDQSDGFDELDGALTATVATINDTSYAFVVGEVGDGVQIIDITTPSDPSAVSSVTNGGDFTTLDKPFDVAYGSYGGNHYLFVAALDSNGVQVMNITTPSNPLAAGSISLSGAYGIEFMSVDGTPYIFITGGSTGANANIYDATDLSSAAATISGLSNPDYCEVAQFDGGYYFFVADQGTNTLYIYDVADPTSPVEASTVTDGVSGCEALGGAHDVSYFKDGSQHFVIVAAYSDPGFQIVNVTDPYSATCVGSGTNGDGEFDFLGQPFGVTTFTLSNNLEDSTRNFAVLPSRTNRGLQAVDLSDPTSPTSAGKTYNGLTNNFGIGVGTLANGDVVLVVPASGSDAVAIYDVNS